VKEGGEVRLKVRAKGRKAGLLEGGDRLGEERTGEGVEGEEREAYSFILLPNY